MNKDKRQLDFILQFRKFLENFKFKLPITIGAPLTDPSIGIVSMPGGSKRPYMDGSMDRTFNIQIDVKVNTAEHKLALEIFEEITSGIENLEDLPSESGTYDFTGIEVKSFPSLVAGNERYYIYSISVAAEIHIYKGVRV